LIVQKQNGMIAMMNRSLTSIPMPAAAAAALASYYYPWEVGTS
jgi:hypothetical protein